MMNVTDYTNIKTLLIKFKEKSDVLYAKAAALSNYATIEWVGTQIPSVGNGTVTIKQNGTSKGSFSMNQSGGATINLTDTTYSSLSAVSGGADKSLVTTGEKYTWNNKWDYNATTIAGVKVNNAVAADKAPWSGITGKPTTLSGYGITDASRIFRYTIPASGNKGVRITFTSAEPVKITVSGANQGAQLVLVGTGYGAGGFLRNNFTELVQSTSYYTWGLADEACSVEVFSVRTTPDMVTVESPSPVTFTAISALSTAVAYRHLLTTANYSSYALPLTGGTISGEVSFAPGAHLTLLGPDNIKHSLGVFSSYPDNLLHWNSTAGWQRIWDSGNSNKINVNWTCDMMTSMNIGSLHTAVFDANNPDRWINSDYGSANRNFSNMPEGWSFGTVLTIGLQGYKGDLNAQFVWDVQHYGDINNPGRLWWRTKNAPIGWKNWKEIYHTGNCNLPTIPWTCSSLTATNDVTAKAGLYGQYLEFTSIGSSAGHGGFIDFHFNGNTADYTSRIIEDAAGQLTLRAGTINIGTAAKCFLYLQRPSVNYIWANTKGGEICIGTADGGETSELNSGINIIGKRVYIGGTVTGNNALNVAGVAHATTGIYTDGYISARRQDTASDIKLKKDFRKIDNALKYVLNTHYTRFRWKDDDKESIGIIAQEEQNREYGFLVQNRREVGHLTYDYAASTALLGAAIQEEDSKVEKLRKRIIKLENELSNLKKKWQH